jgi:allophanate hydrolase subunit 2
LCIIAISDPGDLGVYNAIITVSNDSSEIAPQKHTAQDAKFPTKSSLQAAKKNNAQQRNNQKHAKRSQLPLRII